MRWRLFPIPCLAAAIYFAFAGLNTPAIAMEGGQSPAVRGYRDFMVGVLPAPGVQFRYDLYMYSGTEHSIIPQGQLTINLKAAANIFGVTAVTPYQILGGNYAFGARGAVTDLSVDQTVSRPGLTVARSGSLTALNDIVVSPFIVGWHAGNFHWIVSTSVWMPAGNYDSSRIANTGRHYWSFAPQFGATYFDPKSGWELSAAAMYVISSTNTATNYHSGDFTQFDFAAGKMLSPQFKLGAVGYFVQQVTPDSGAGAILGDRKLRVAGIGPAATYTFFVNKVAMNLVAKYYREFDAQNTTQGNAGTVSVRVKF